MIKAIVVALTLLLQTLLYGQQTLYSGRVIDALYGTPVPYASVFVDNTQIGAVADNVGEFSFQLPDSLRYRRLVGVGNGYSIAYFWPDQEDPSALLIELVPSETAQGTVSPLGGPPQKQGAFGSFLNRAVQLVLNDWIPLGDPETNRFDFGRIQTFPTYNPIEGVRLRAGVASNSRLSPHLFLK
ncbi:MAG: carboxypeptidase-like regulatory domain-containing protein, partial [Proteiniphilum sp.]